MNQGPTSIEAQIADVQRRLAEARKRIPKHDTPLGLMVEIDTLEEELAHLQALARPRSVQEQIAELEARLRDAVARIPKHDAPPSLMAEIDEMEERLEHLHSLEDS
jgi:chromosome segregation ATPase